MHRKMNLRLLTAMASLCVLNLATAGYVTSLGVTNTFVEPGGWAVDATHSTYQEWDTMTANTGNLPDHGNTNNPILLTNATHSVKPPGFLTGSKNFYAWTGHYGATADIYNHGGNGGTHVIVQTGSSLNYDTSLAASYGDGSHTNELVAGHGWGNFWDTLKIVDLNGNPIPGGDNASALQIAEVSYRENVPSSFGPVDYQELIYEFWLPGYTGDFRVDWDQIQHATMDTLRVDTLIAAQPFPITPVSPVTTFCIESATAANGQITLQWPGAPGETFWIAVSADLTNWVTVATNLVPVGGTVTWSTNTAQPLQFFRAAK